MKTVYFDIRGGALKVLVTDGMSVRYAKIFNAFSLEDTENARKTFRQISEESGVKPDMVHLIPPAGEVKIKTYKLQKMSLDDARMIVRRRIVIEEGIGDPVFHLLGRDSGGRQQEFVAAVIEPERLKQYVTLLSGYGIKVKILSSSFHSKLRAFEHLKSEMPRTCAIFEVGTDAVEIMVVSPGTVTYHTVPVSPGGLEESLEGSDIERMQKKRLYGIVEALYEFMISYREDSADMPIEKVLLCGRIDNPERTAGAVEEGIGIGTSPWNPFGEAVPNGSEFAALYGLSLGVSDGTAVNLIAAEFSRRRQIRISRTAMAALFCLYLAAIVSVCFIAETRYENAKKMLGAGLKEKQALALIAGEAGRSPDLTASLRRLAVKQQPLYGVFRYLGNNLPDGVALDEVLFKQVDGDEILQLGFVSKYDLNVGKKRYFTGVTESISGSGRLSLMKEPTFSVSGDTKNPLIHFQITCKVIPYETKK